MEQPNDAVRRQLKILLLYLAARSDHPSRDLQALLKDVIAELHSEVAAKLKPKLKLVVHSET